ncbi:MAG TPA: FtsX-like permease family protein [Acidobacteriota bacterium]|nr:FtsX-like permease family protein [Acidobacteriota bacterium]
MRFAFYLAVRNLLRHPARNLLTILGISITAALLLDMTMLSGGIKISLSRMLHNLGYEVRISPRGTLPFETDAQIHHFREIQKRLARDPAVFSVDALLGTTISASHQGNVFTSFAIGLERQNNPLYQIISGREPERNRKEVMINQYLARDKKICTGDTLKLWVASRSENTGDNESTEVKVTGIGYFGLDADGQYTISTTLPFLQGLLDARGEDPVSVILLKLNDAAQADRVASSVNDQYRQFSAYTIASVVEVVDKQLSYFKQFAYILGGISLIVTFVLILIITTISFHDRVGEIALLGAIGLSRKTLFTAVLFEGFLTSVLAVIFGFVLGKIVAIYLDAILKSAPGLPEAFSFFVLEPRSLVRAILVLLITGIVAGLYPAGAAARLPIAQTLREEIL